MSPARGLTLRVPDLAFGAVLLMILLGGRPALMNDPGTFWHLRLGREIAHQGAVPRYDVLTYSHEHDRWIDQSWLFDLGLAAVVDRWGWSGAIAAASLGLAVLYALVARSLVVEGCSPLSALAVALFAAAVGSIHFLIRPHLFTFVFFFWTLQVCRRQHEQGGWALWVVPPLMVAWANLHGGFVSGPVIVLTAGFGHALSGAWASGRRHELVPFAVVFVLSCLTPLLNPYGAGLYRHVVQLLMTSGVTELIAEYQPIPFGRSEYRNAEILVLALVALPAFSRARMSRYDALHTLVWLHFALTSLRNQPLFALAAAPGLARLVDGALTPTAERVRWSASWSVWPAAAGLMLAILVGWGLPLNQPPTKWPLAAVRVVDREPLSARLFHELSWGGLIESECQPTRRAYLDDRFELFGKQAVLDYMIALEGGPKWDELDDREHFDLVWIQPDRGLATRLEKDSKWQEVHRDAVSVLFRRRASG
jgi:hypothetical protein